MIDRDYSFSKGERVCNRGECKALFSDSRSLFCFPFKVLYRTVESGTGLRVLISAPKKYHKRAVKRNKIKRRAREAFRLNKHLYYQGLKGDKESSVDICFIYISKKVEEYDVIEKSIKRAISEVTNATRKGDDHPCDGTH